MSAEAVPAEKRGAAIGAYRTFFDLGSFIGPILMTAIMTQYPIVYTFYVAAGLMIMTLPLVFSLKETSKIEGEIIAH